jgi:hypothetical protein
MITKVKIAMPAEIDKTLGLFIFSDKEKPCLQFPSPSQIQVSEA